MRSASPSNCSIKRSNFRTVAAERQIEQVSQLPVVGVGGEAGDRVGQSSCSPSAARSKTRARAVAISSRAVASSSTSKAGETPASSGKRASRYWQKEWIVWILRPPGVSRASANNRRARRKSSPLRRPRADCFDALQRGVRRRASPTRRVVRTSGRPSRQQQLWCRSGRECAKAGRRREGDVSPDWRVCRSCPFPHVRIPTPKPRDPRRAPIRKAARSFFRPARKRPFPHAGEVVVIVRPRRRGTAQRATGKEFRPDRIARSAAITRRAARATRSRASPLTTWVSPATAPPEKRM